VITWKIFISFTYKHDLNYCILNIHLFELLVLLWHDIYWKIAQFGVKQQSLTLVLQYIWEAEDNRPNLFIIFFYVIFNSCLSPLTLWVWTPLKRGVLDTTLCDKVWYYTLRFYFPYLSLLAQPVNITLYGPAMDCLVFKSLFREIIGLVFECEV